MSTLSKKSIYSLPDFLNEICHVAFLTSRKYLGFGQRLERGGSNILLLRSAFDVSSTWLEMEFYLRYNHRPFLMQHFANLSTDLYLVDIIASCSLHYSSLTLISHSYNRTFLESLNLIILYDLTAIGIYSINTSNTRRSVEHTVVQPLTPPNQRANIICSGSNK